MLGVHLILRSTFRYLKNGFEAVVASAQPQMILFLGDLFDEGVIMSSQEFEWTLERFENIFSHIKNIPVSLSYTY